MMYEGHMRQCPICNHKLRHKLGTKKYFCPYCRTFFFKEKTAVYVKRSCNQQDSVPLNVIKQRLDGYHSVNAKVVRTVFKEVVNINKSGDVI